jgi:hypothetical protein
MPEPDDRRGNWLVQFMTTEHFTLMTARSSSVAESNGRATIYLTTLSSSIVALALIAELSKVGVLFFTFAFVLLPMVFFLGLVTSERILQLSIEYHIYSRSINRIRGYYAETTPDMARYYIMPATDDPTKTMAGFGISGRWRFAITMAGTIAIINNLVAGTFAGLAVGAVVAEGGAGTGFTLVAAASTGFIVFVFVSLSFFRHQRAIALGHYGHQVPTMFPGEDEPTPNL